MKDLPIIFSPHALESMRKRGADKAEVEQAIRVGKWEESHKERFEAKLEFPFNTTWNNKEYKTKQINPVFVVEDGTIVVITVYVFYF